MKTILLTGATGFIGQKISNIIKSEYSDLYEVVLLSSVRSKIFNTILHNNYTFHKNNFLEKNINKIDIVLHFGAFIPSEKSEADNIERSNSNIINTKYLIDNLPCLPKKLIFASTTDVYGITESKIDENSTINPATMYGWSKLYCEKMLEKWCLDNNVVLQILRLGHIYGAGEERYRKLIPITIDNVKLNITPKVYGNGKELRSYLNIKDACYLTLESLNLNTYEKPINVCSSLSYSIDTIVKKIISISRKDINIEYIYPSPLIPYDLVFDVSKMQEILGTEKITIEDGLREEYEFFKKNMD